LPAVDRLDLADLARQRARTPVLLRPDGTDLAHRHPPAVPARARAVRVAADGAPHREEARPMSSATAYRRARASGGVRSLYSGNSSAVLARGLLATRSTNWWIVLTGVFEPIFDLLSLGIGLGGLIGTVQDSSGNDIVYAAFIAPALLEVS